MVLLHFLYSSKAFKNILLLIKQSHIILNFLAMEGRITNEHIDAVWSSAQLKHCSRQVLDLLPPLIKNLEVAPVLHLYKLLCNVETKEQTEQTLLLASALIKFIWSNGNTSAGMIVSEIGDHSNAHSPFSVLMKGSLHMDASGADISGMRKREPSSSERSVSIEPSNSEDERSDVRHVHTASELQQSTIAKHLLFEMIELDSSQVSDRPRSSIEGSEHTNGSPSSSPCDVEQHKQLLKHAQRKRNTSQRHQNGRKWRHTCRGRVRPTVFVESKNQFVENSSSGEESELSSHKHSELSQANDKTHLHCPPAPEILPELVKAVLDRDENLSGFSENLDNDMYDCRQYLANLRPQHHVPVTGFKKLFKTH
ncbi:UNVERIFIED_CONTAM: Ubiquitin carboxyl-terminal hydrolase 34 [Trichonephila clavipes]